MYVQLWCKTHKCVVGEVDPNCPVFEYNDIAGQFDIRWDNTYCHFDREKYNDFQSVHDYTILT